MRQSTKGATVLVVLVLAGAWLVRDDRAVDPARGPVDAPATTELLQAASGGDGDSWKDTSGRAYRLGMVNAPEVGECWSAEATAARRALIADGFRADVYAQDRYGRGVSLVTAADGTNVNVALARSGHVDDRYLDDFRHENRPLAAQLDAAFSAAKRERAGLWGACAGG